MEGNVVFVSERGLRFLSMDQVETHKLVTLVEELKQTRLKNTQYKFIISFNDQPEVECDDVWVALGVSSARY